VGYNFAIAVFASTINFIFSCSIVNGGAGFLLVRMRMAIDASPFFT
jgi:hypothetical protein